MKLKDIIFGKTLVIDLVTKEKAVITGCRCYTYIGFITFNVNNPFLIEDLNKDFSEYARDASVTFYIKYFKEGHGSWGEGKKEKGIDYWFKGDLIYQKIQILPNLYTMLEDTYK